MSDSAAAQAEPNLPQSRTRRHWLMGGAAVLAAGAGAGTAWWQSRADGAGEVLGADFWSRRFDRVEGGELQMSALRGKPLLLNFWATWCAPCVEEMPMIDRFYKEHAANGLQVVGLAIDQPSAVRKFLQRTPVSYDIGLAGMSGTEMIRQLGNAQGGLPFTLAIDTDGGIAARKMGKLEQSEIEAWRRELFHG